MQHSSPSIANLAAALAKAQGELVNPEKSLTATVRSDGRGEQSFRYASLSSGLDIVRKTLGQHEIANRTGHHDRSDRWRGQSNHDTGACIGRVDRIRMAGLSDQRDGNAVRRMGAALLLRFPMRYALFSTGGHCREDDPHAPDLSPHRRAPQHGSAMAR